MIVSTAILKTFFAYAHDDFKPQAKSVTTYLKKYSHNSHFYIDQIKSKGKKFKKINEENLKNSNVLVVIITPASIVSSEIAKEVKIAKENKLDIIPCKSDCVEIEWDDLPWELSDYDGIEFHEVEDLKISLLREISQINKEYLINKHREKKHLVLTQKSNSSNLNSFVNKQLSEIIPYIEIIKNNYDTVTIHPTTRDFVHETIVKALQITIDKINAIKLNVSRSKNFLDIELGVKLERISKEMEVLTLNCENKRGFNGGLTKINNSLHQILDDLKPESRIMELKHVKKINNTNHLQGKDVQNSSFTPQNKMKLVEKILSGELEWEKVINDHRYRHIENDVDYNICQAEKDNMPFGFHTRYG